MQQIPKALWTPSLIEQVERAAIDNVDVREANLVGGRPVPEAAEEILRDVRGEPEAAAADDDIPF